MNPATRIPITIAARIPRGLHRIGRAINRWRTDTKNQPAYEAALAASPARYMQLRTDREQRRKQRTGLLVIAFCMLGIVALLADWFVGAWTWQTAAAALFVTTIAAGGSPNSPKIPIGTKPHNSPITDSTVREALTSAIPEIARATKDNPGALTFPDPPARDGNGWHIRAELPQAVTAAHVANRQEELASAFRRPTLAISIEPDPAHSGMAALWIADALPTGIVQWPLVDDGTVDILTGFPIGIDVRGRPVDLSLMNKNGLIGAMPGYGKTVTLRMILLAAALDPRTKIYAYDLKGGVDLLPFKPVAERVVTGDEPEDLENLRDDLRTIQSEIRARNKRFKALPVDEMPDGQITTADATRLGISPIVFAIDEAQMAYEDDTYGKDIAALTIDIFKRGRSVGIHMLLVTQQFDKESVPPRITRSAQLRICGRVDGFQESNMILGATAHSSGVSATVFGEDDKGAMWVKGSGRTRIVRMAMVTAVQARQVIARAAEVRAVRAPIDSSAESFPQLALARPVTAAPSLPPAHDLLGRVLHVWPDGEDKLWTETILGLLRENFPGDYTAMTVTELSAKLPGKSKQIWKKPAGADKGSNRQGYIRDGLARLAVS